nr:hypothetical protein [Acinetobacter baumannii]
MTLFYYTSLSENPHRTKIPANLAYFSLFHTDWYIGTTNIKKTQYSAFCEKLEAYFSTIKASLKS